MNNTLTEQSQKREKTELVLMKVYNLPPIPRVISEVLKLLDNRSTNTSEITRHISKDQSLVTKILTIANSPLYGLQRRVTSIDFAILVLGFGELRNIISVLSMMESFKNKTDRYLNQKEFWLHSFLTGSATKRLAEDLGFPDSGEAFIAGFLHDMGVSVLHRYFHTNFVTIYEQVNNGGKTYEEAEMEILGMTHQEIGHMLMERWNFPNALCDVILNHHTPGESKSNLLLASLVHLADYMTHKLDIGNFAWDKDLTLKDEAKSALRFNSDEEVEEFIENYREIFEKQVETVKIIQ